MKTKEYKVAGRTVINVQMKADAELLDEVVVVGYGTQKKSSLTSAVSAMKGEELLKSPTMERVVIAELDEKVIDISRRYFAAVHHGALDDARVDIRIGDGMKYVNEDGPAAGDRYDLIVLDLTDPVGPAEALYTEDFFRACRALLDAGGALSLHIGPPVFQPERVRELVQRLRRVFTTVCPYFLYMPLYGSLWGLATASDTLNPQAISADEIDRRLEQRRIKLLHHYNGAVHQAQFALPNHLRALLA